MTEPALQQGGQVLLRRVLEQAGLLADAHVRARRAEAQRDDEILDWRRRVWEWEQQGGRG